MNTNIENAVILAAGMGTRLRSVTDNMIPKGFLEIEGKGLVQRSIEKLFEAGIKKVYIATGHLNEFYDKLAEADSRIITMKNENFSNTGSMASLAIFRDVLKEDFILLESDLIYETRALEEVINCEKEDCMLLSGKTNSGDEVYIEVKNDNLSGCSKCKDDIKEIAGELVGITKVSNSLYKYMIEEYDKSDIQQYHYENTIIDAAKHKKVGYKKIDDIIWAEIDDESHLERVKRDILPRLREKGEV
ncbi:MULTISPECIES: phosphocholine cytidylyltransferase family protein [Clostridium]|uniref:phosphocholine cytidylyltransferase family protein n=1 Tax=Clostridium TaxID=1485 RepID=UPI002902369C|nr:phosphocholine cytidylyltransferase family protein [Clostridium sp.]MDU1969122.1 phosphocholine cytidylyltransferase family protein [Clostridium perfringens]MDU1825265.1 phosphocholine cytidylyltransferase family protein [Clostridium sp.]MDU1843185.1 phosphocholine cytidylyltransferase family protein [Clostridium sp.]MDU1979814.1 phosphocholine cytidylyltransferase family protein [Clostridium sp.]MDU1995564.1 phosphocholine cytidylyltransferase family protein [Clostridium sp.]